MSHKRHRRRQAPGISDRVAAIGRLLVASTCAIGLSACIVIRPGDSDTPDATAGCKAANGYVCVKVDAGAGPASTGDSEMGDGAGGSGAGSAGSTSQHPGGAGGSKAGTSAGGSISTSQPQAGSTGAARLDGGTDGSVGSEGEPIVDAAISDAGAQDAGAVDAGHAEPCVVAPEDQELVETRCDGIDNDCDGVTDVLLPLPENACSGSGNLCGGGFADCIGGAKVCLAQGAAPEVKDGVDNDCNGHVDDFDTSYEIRPRALVLVPSYFALEGPSAIDNVTSFLSQWGVPYDVAGPIEDFDVQLSQLSGHSLAIVPGYLDDEVLSPTQTAALETFANAGGIVVVFKPILSASNALLGLGSSAQHTDLDSLEFLNNDAAARVFDSPEERSLPINEAGLEPVEAFVYSVSDPSVRVIAEATRGGATVGPVITYRPIGAGGIYAVGHDLYSFSHYRCYINCFEPSGDMAGLFLREAYRDSARGHIALLHTVPGSEDSLVTLTHDVDAPDAQNAGPVWGAPGAVQVATLEHSYAARGSYMITTDYIAGYYSPQLMPALCDLGMCPVGTHSVTHSNMTNMSMGDCNVTQATYNRNALSVCGEVHVSMAMLERDVGKRPIAWRAPYLGIPPELYDVLASEGILFDSSYAVGDLKFNLPLSMANTSINEWVFHRHAMYSMPISIEDGIGETSDGSRSEMSDENGPLFVHHWVNVMLRNADNHAFTMALLHPSYGLHVPETNLRNKLVVLEAFLKAAVARGVKFDLTVDQLALFWRAREASRLDVEYAGGVYSGTLTTGPYAVQNLTLEFGEPVSAFSCGNCGQTRIAGKRVVLESPLDPSTSYAFTADALPE